MQESPSPPDADHPAEDPDAEAAPKKRFRFGLVFKATAAMLVIGLAPLLLFSAVTLTQQGTRLREEASRSMQSVTERMASQVDEWVDKNVRALETAAMLPSMTSMQPAEQSKVLAAIKKEYPWMYLVFTIAPSGANVARSDDQPLISYAERNYFKDVVSKNRNLAWETLISKTSKKPALILAVPIRVENTLVGVLAAGVNIEDLTRIVANWHSGSSGFAFLVDENGKVIAHPSEELVLQQRGMQTHPLVSQFAADGKPHLATFKEGGNEALGYIQGLRFHWAVAAQQNEAELLAPQRQTLMIGLLLLGSAAVLVVLIAMGASKLLVHPIVDMTHAAEHMSIGELDTPIKSTSKDELGMLAKALERLRKSMVAAIARM